MAQIIVRKLDKKLKEQLAMYARQKGHSMEEEVRQIIKNALARRNGGLGTRAAETFQALCMDFDIPELKGEDVRNPFETE